MTGHRGETPSPKSSEEARVLFRTLVPNDERVTVRPMFGSVAAFIEGQMFMYLFADDLYVRLSPADREAVTAAGGGPLEPMPGRPMREYVDIPDWRSDEQTVRQWGAQALDFALTLPPKKKPPKKPPKKRLKVAPPKPRPASG
ncbi:MAG: TfoX/Sxy family protein [Candidatus Limnocylindrales bacterium]